MAEGRGHPRGHSQCHKELGRTGADSGHPPAFRFQPNFIGASSAAELRPWCPRRGGSGTRCHQGWRAGGSGARRSPGKDPSRGVMQAAALVWSRGRSPRSCRLVCGAGGPARLCRPRSLPALPVPNCGRGRQELQALLCQQPPGGKDPSSFSRQPWAASRTRLERVEAVAGAGRSWQCHSGSPRPRG